MSEEREKYIFGKNLSYYVDNSLKDQKTIAKELGFPHTTFNTWCKGKIIPSMGKVQKIADYFGIGKTDLLDEKINNNYYINDETSKMAQEIFENKDLQLLFNASKNASPEDLKAAADYIMFLKNKERGE